MPVLEGKRRRLGQFACRQINLACLILLSNSLDEPALLAPVVTEVCSKESQDTRFETVCAKELLFGIGEPLFWGAHKRYGKSAEQIFLAAGRTSPVERRENQFI